MTFTVIKQDFTKDAKTTIFIFIDLASISYNQEKQARQQTIINWNHNQSSAVVVTCGTFLLEGSILPISLYKAILYGSTTEECNICAL